MWIQNSSTHNLVNGNEHIRIFRIDQRHIYVKHITSQGTQTSQAHQFLNLNNHQLHNKQIYFIH